MRIINWDEYENHYQALLEEWHQCNDDLCFEKRKHFNVALEDWYFLGVEEECLNSLPMIRSVRKLTDAVHESGSEACRKETEGIDKMTYSFLNQFIAWTENPKYYSDERCREFGKNLNSFLLAFQNFLENGKTQQTLSITQVSDTRALTANLKLSLAFWNKQADDKFQSLFQEEDNFFEEWKSLNMDILKESNRITMEEWRRLLVIIEKIKVLSFLGNARACVRYLADIPDCSLDIFYESVCLWKELVRLLDDFIRYCEFPPRETGHFEDTACQELEDRTYDYLMKYKKLTDSVLRI